MLQDPFRDLMNLQERMRRLFEESLHSTTSKGASSPSWNPPVDIYETAQEVVLEAELPQVRKEDIEIQVESNTLVLRGQRDAPEVPQTQRSYHQRERPFGHFQRRFPLPPHIDAGQIQARHQDGVLIIRIAKMQESPARHIQID